MFSQSEIETINIKFDEVSKIAKNRADKLFDVLNQCNENEALCLKYLYGYMPLADLSDYEGELFLTFVRQALKAREATPWGNSISTEEFLNYVLAYRINNENIEDYRQEFFDELFPRINKMNMYDAVLEVNMWCFEKCRYKTTDRRTASPKTTLKNVYGRCGESSVLTVSALRSVCIPARQCYTPAWAHCDDNHAWVEVLVDGNWCYLGACEPDPILNKGWFGHVATRAMLINNRVFSTIVTGEDIFNQTTKVTDVNILHRYADTRRLTVKVTDNNAQPIEGADVMFQIVNYCDLVPLAVIKTNANGEAQLSTGYGDLYINVVKDGKYTHTLVDLRKTDFCSVDFSKSVDFESEDYEFDLVPPMAKALKDEKITEKAQNVHDEKSKKSEKIRNDYEATFFNEESAKAYASEYGELKDDIAEILVGSCGNHDIIKNYISRNDGIETRLKVLYLKSLRKKDLTDITTDILDEHLHCSMKYKDCFEEEIFIENILCPCISYEMITKYKNFIENYFDADLIEDFKSDPMKVYEYINKNIEDTVENEYKVLLSSPVGALEMKKASKLSKNNLFVAMCRSFGIPSRLSKTDGTLDFYKNGEWHKVTKKEVKSSKIKIISQYDECDGDKLSEDNLSYMKNFTIAKLENGRYMTLRLWRKDEGDILEYEVSPGNYRALTVVRRPDGDILARAHHFTVNDNETKEISLKLRKDDINDTLRNVEIEPIVLNDENGTQLAFGKKTIVAWLEPGKEPTEHLLNEMIQRSNEFENISTDIVFILKDKYDGVGVLGQALKSLPKIKLCYDSKLPENIFKSFEIPEKLPLTVVLKDDSICLYATSGYNVGLSETLLKLSTKVG